MHKAQSTKHKAQSTKHKEQGTRNKERAKGTQSPMRSLVTGGSGFIGTHLCRLLLAQGHEVLNFDALTYAAVRDTPPDIHDHPAYHFLQADITDATAVRSALEAFRPDLLFHLAAETHVDRSIADPAPFLHTNIQGTHTLLEAFSLYIKNQKSTFINRQSGGKSQAPEAKDQESEVMDQKRSASNLPLLPLITMEERHRGTDSNSKPPSNHRSRGTSSSSPAPKSKLQTPQESFRFLHISTDEVYGHLGPDDPPFTESSPFRPRSPYAASKAAAEHLVHAWHTTYGLPTIIVRPSNTYGPHQHAEKFIPTILHHARNGKPIPIYGNGENIRDWLHVEDHARAILAAATHGTIGHAYNISGGNEMSNIDLVRLLCRILDEESGDGEEGIGDGRGEMGVWEEASALAPELQTPNSKLQRRSRPPNSKLQSPISSGKAAPPNSNLQSPISSGKAASLITFTPDRPGHDFRYALDTTKARQQLHWSPQIDLPTGLRQTIRHAP